MVNRFRANAPQDGRRRNQGRDGEVELVQIGMTKDGVTPVAILKGS